MENRGFTKKAQLMKSVPYTCQKVENTVLFRKVLRKKGKQMRIDIATLFPDACRKFLSISMTGIAVQKGIVDLKFHQIRDYTQNRQKQTEGRPFGGGNGKILSAQPIGDCIEAVIRDCVEKGKEKPYVVFMTPAGKPYTQAEAKRLAGYECLLLVCGHYEGIDERVIKAYADEELSIGDYVLTGGELPAMTVADSVIRLLPGVLKTEGSVTEESFWDGLLEYPQYTRPAVWKGRSVPEVLLSGDHGKVETWRNQEREERTRLRRPDLMQTRAITGRKAHFHLPGLFEFYEFYRLFLPLYRQHREYFYDWCEIRSVYGAPEGCLWGGGRVGCGRRKAEDVLSLMREYGVSACLTFSNSLLREQHLSDRTCNTLCALFEKGGDNGIIVHSELLLRYLKKTYPGLYLVSSTTKVLTDFEQLRSEAQRKEFRYVVPDFRLNKAFSEWKSFDPKEKMEFLCNECCYTGCRDRKACYENVSRRNLGETTEDFICRAPGGEEGYRFSKAMGNPGFIGLGDIRETYLPMGFSEFKIEGRGLGNALLLEFLLYYMIKPEAQIKVREAIYLDSMLDLF